MGDSVLKKEFQERDVQRIRNIMTGKHGEKVGQSVGYNKSQEEHVEGDVWEEDGRDWTIKDGILQNITKLDSAKKQFIPPLFCPECSKPMKKRFDKDYFRLHKKCYDCVIEFETELRRIGAYEEYEKRIHNSEIEGFIEDFKVFINEQLESNTSNFITEAGDEEKWSGGIDKQRVLDSVESTIKYLDGLKRE